MTFEESANNLAQILLNKGNVPILVISHPGGGSWYAVHYCLYSECNYEQTMIMTTSNNPEDNEDYDLEDVSMCDSYYIDKKTSKPLTESELFDFIKLIVSYKKAIGDNIISLNNKAPIIFDLDVSLYSKETIDNVKLYFDNIVEF